MVQYIPITVISIVMNWAGTGPNAFYSHITATGNRCSMWELLSSHRPTLPAETRVIRWWRLDHLLKNIRGNFAGECKASNPIHSDVCGCSLVDCQASRYEQSFRIIATIHYSGSWCEFFKTFQWWPYLHICCCTSVLLPPVVSKKNQTFQLCWKSLLRDLETQAVFLSRVNKVIFFSLRNITLMT